MAVVLACTEDPQTDIRLNAAPSYNAQTGVFSLPRPIGDDWLQRIEYSPSPSPLLVRVQDHTLFIVFATAAEVQSFSRWLEATVAESAEGFRTLRG